MSPLIMRTCEEFARQGIDVELWVPRRVNTQYPASDPFTHYKIEPNFTIRKLPVIDLMPWVPGIGFPLMVLTFSLSLWWSGREQPEETVWYFHDLRDAFFVTKKYMFLEVHDFYESRFRWLNRMVFGGMRGFIVTNKIKMARLRDAYGISESRMIHLPNAVDAARFNRPETKREAREKLGLPQDKKLVIYTGSIFKWKGVHTLARAAAFLPEDTEIIFAGGNDKERADFQKFIEEEYLPRSRLMPLPYEELERAPLFMRAADVLVLPNTAEDPASKYETSPVKLFEYMASGTPIVASDLPSIRNVVDDSTVWFFRPDDPEALARVILQAASEVPSSKPMNSQNAVQQYYWEERIRKALSFISSFLLPE